MHGEGVWKRAGSMAILGLVAACGDPGVEGKAMPGADPARGRALVARAGCGACHAIPGVDWPQGRVGPPLQGFADRALIAGRIPNEPSALTRWVRNAPEMDHASAMPPMPLSEQEARDVAAFLYTLHDD